MKKVRARANAGRSAKAKQRPRKEDGTLASGATDSGTTGSKPNRASAAKAAAAGVDRGTVEKVEAIVAAAADVVQ